MSSLVLTVLSSIRPKISLELAGVGLVIGLMTTIQPEKPAKRPWDGVFREYIRKKPRSLVPLIYKTPKSTFDAAILMVLPWIMSDYPGIERGSVELLGNRASVKMISYWRRGLRRIPDWAIDALAGYLEQRARSMLAVASELRSAPRAKKKKLTSVEDREI